MVEDEEEELGWACCYQFHKWKHLYLWRRILDPLCFRIPPNYRGHDVDLLENGGQVRARVVNCEHVVWDDKRLTTTGILVTYYIDKEGTLRTGLLTWNLVSGRENGQWPWLLLTNRTKENSWKVTEAVRVDEYTKYCIEGHWLFGITPCYVYFRYVSYCTNKCQIGCLDITEHLQLHLVQNYIDSEKI